MNRDYFVSVAMATYNGEKYIYEQLESILEQLGDNDEIIISDDGSTDATKDIVKKFNDKRIRIIEGPRKGVKQNFANAISECKGKYIFLCDQDDIWDNKKIDKVLQIFDKEKGVVCVVHDAIVFDSDTNGIMYDSFFKFRKSKAGIIKNIWKNSYIGCCMTFAANIKDVILPIPDDIEMHDQWIGIICEKYGKSVYLNEKLIRYRRHSSNVSSVKHHPINKMIKNRFVFVKELIKRGKNHEK